MRDRGELSQDANPTDIALAVLAAVRGGLLLSKGEKSNRPLEAAFEMALASTRFYRMELMTAARDDPLSRIRASRQESAQGSLLAMLTFASTANHQ